MEIVEEIAAAIVALLIKKNNKKGEKIQNLEPYENLNKNKINDKPNI